MAPVGTNMRSGKQVNELESQYYSAEQLEQLTGTPASTWRYWAHLGTGPTSIKIGRRRVWKRSSILAWLEAKEKSLA
jgi:prophage regulatory protein